MPLWTELTDRGVIAVSGTDAADFLHGLLSADIDKLAVGQARFAALLSPQGKILFDGLVLRGESGFFIDCRRDICADFARRLGFYKLRSAVDIRDASDELLVAAIWPGEGAIPPSAFVDPRCSELGLRAIVARAALDSAVKGWNARAATLADYHKHRIANAVPDGGLDYAYGDAFPHDANLDRLGGVSFTKGCYVGQEVVSRMHHRGTVRTRIVPVIVTGAAVSGSEVKAAGRRIGTLGSVEQGNGLAMLRLDKVKSALDAGARMTADGASIDVILPDWARRDLGGGDGVDEGRG